MKAEASVSCQPHHSPQLQSLADLLRKAGVAIPNPLPANTQQTLLHWLSEKDLAGPDLLYACVANHLQRPFLSKLPDIQALVPQFPSTLALKYRVIPISIDRKQVEVCFQDPFCTDGLPLLEFYFKRTIAISVLPPAEVRNALHKYYLNGIPGAPTEVTISETHRQDWWIQMLTSACHECASDIYLERDQDCLHIRFRIDGVLCERGFWHNTARERTATAKVAANLDVNEQNLPQDGRFHIALVGRTLDLRIATLPTPDGESITIRLLDPEKKPLSFAALAFPKIIEEAVRAVIQSNNGLFLVTGPTGSGKTTTLHCALRTLDTKKHKIVTAEDPVEYTLNGIVQTEINPLIGNTFPNILRGLLRQDPDTILIGEIRDAPTAQIALQAAVTGHLVLSTLHTSDCINAILRLREMDGDPFAIANTLEGILNQRLLRLLCPSCKRQIGPHFEAHGCPSCKQTGYIGRKPIFEWLAPSPDLRMAICSGAPPQHLRAQAHKDGMRPLTLAAHALLQEGLTSQAELARQIGYY